MVTPDWPGYFCKEPFWHFLPDIKLHTLQKFLQNLKGHFGCAFLIQQVMLSKLPSCLCWACEKVASDLGLGDGFWPGTLLTTG